jgi:hypothetical protein
MSYLLNRIEAWKHNQRHRREQIKLAELSAELEIAMEESAALAIHIGELNRLRAEIQNEMHRREA